MSALVSDPPLHFHFSCANRYFKCVCSRGEWTSRQFSLNLIYCISVIGWHKRFVAIRQLPVPQLLLFILYLYINRFASASSIQQLPPIQCTQPQPMAIHTANNICKCFLNWKRFFFRLSWMENVSLSFDFECRFQVEWRRCCVVSAIDIFTFSQNCVRPTPFARRYGECIHRTKQRKTNFLVSNYFMFSTRNVKSIERTCAPLVSTNKQTFGRITSDRCHPEWRCCCCCCCCTRGHTPFS